MNTQRPMSYDCWKSIIQNFDVSTRFSLSQRCPQLRNIHSLLPLTIKTLRLVSFGSIQIGNTLFKVGIIRKYVKGTPSQMRDDENKMGGVEYDVEQFGDLNNWNVRQRIDEDRPLTAMEMEKLKDYQSRRDQILNTVEKMRKSRKRTMEFREFERQISQNPQYETRFQNSQAKFSHYFQFSKVENGNVEILGRALSDRSIHLAKVYFAQKFFSGSLMRVQNLVVEDQFFLELSLTSLNVQKLEIHAPNLTKILNSIDGVLTRKSIDHLEIHRDTDFSHPLVHTAKLLNIKKWATPRNFMEFSNNKKVNFATYGGLTVDRAGDLIQTWRTQNYEVGRVYTFKVIRYGIEDLWRAIKEMPDAVEKDFECEGIVLELWFSSFSLKKQWKFLKIVDGSSCAYTYAFALEMNNDSELFEANQNDVQQATEEILDFWRMTICTP